MKKFTTIKMGYTAGIYGNSGEYFTTIILNDNDEYSIAWQGQYGPEYRMAEVLKAAGYKEFHTRSGDYGKLSKRDADRRFTDEHKAIQAVKEKIGVVA